MGQLLISGSLNGGSLWGEATTDQRCHVLAVNVNNVAFTTNTMTNVSFTAVSADNLGNYNIATGIFTPPSDGIYQFDAQVTFKPASGGAGMYGTIGIYDATNGGTIGITYAGISPGTYQSLRISGAMNLTAGNGVRIRVSQITGNTLNTSSGVSDSFLSVTKIA